LNKTNYPLKFKKIIYNIVNIWYTGNIQIEYFLIKSDGGNRPDDVRQPTLCKGAKSCG